MPKPSAVARVVTVIVNIVFCCQWQTVQTQIRTRRLISVCTRHKVLGCIFFAGGLFVRFGSAILNQLISGVIKNLESALSSSGFGEVDLSSTFNISELLFGVAIGLICFGLFLVIVTVVGCCGSCYKFRVLIIIYIVVCVVVAVGEITVITIFYGFSDVFDNPAKQMLKDSIQSQYKGLNGTNVVSIGWNFVAQKFACCGVDSYSDFTGASGWVVTYTSYTLKTPLACCKTLPDSSDYSCAATSGATDTNNYMNTGCYTIIKDLIFGNVYIVAGTLGGLGLIQIVMIILAVILCMSERRNQVEPMENDKTHTVGDKKSRGHNMADGKPPYYKLNDEPFFNKRIVYKNRKHIPPRY